MCVVSNIGDDWQRQWPSVWPGKLPDPSPTPIVINRPEVSKKEFDELKKLVEQMRDELIAARMQDEREGNEDCEMGEKVNLLKGIAAAMGVDISRAFPND